jgi:hypothetical protein
LGIGSRLGLVEDPAGNGLGFASGTGASHDDGDVDRGDSPFPSVVFCLGAPPYPSGLAIRPLLSSEPSLSVPAFAEYAAPAVLDLV